MNKYELIDKEYKGIYVQLPKGYILNDSIELIDKDNSNNSGFRNDELYEVDKTDEVQNLMILSLYNLWY